MQVAHDTVVSDALVWLKYCQQCGIEDSVKECESVIEQHYAELAKDRPEDLAELSSCSLVRISQAVIGSLKSR